MLPPCKNSIFLRKLAPSLQSDALQSGRENWHKILISETFLRFNKSTAHAYTVLAYTKNLELFFFQIFFHSSFCLPYFYLYVFLFLPLPPSTLFFLNARLPSSGLLFLLRSAVPPVPAARLHLLLRHLLVHWPGERPAAGGRHRLGTLARSS